MDSYGFCMISMDLLGLQVGEMVLDPIKRHVHRRLVRQREQIHAGLEA